MGYFNSWNKTENLTDSIFRTNRPEGKKVKEVYSGHDSLCHAWASGNVFRGRASRMFFENGIIYSFGHHYKAAQIFKTKSRLVTLINSDCPSNTTNGHLWSIKRAVKHTTILRVPDVDPKNNHEENLKYLEELFLSEIGLILELKYHGNVGEFLGLINNYNLYLKTFNLKGAIDINSKDFTYTIEALKQSEKIAYSKKAARDAKRLETKNKKELEIRAKNSVLLRELELDFPSKVDQWVSGEIDDYNFNQCSKMYVQVPAPFGRTDRIALKIDNQVLESQKDRILSHLKARFEAGVSSWRVGCDVSLYGLGQVLDFDVVPSTCFLRVSKNMIETSEHADVPLEHAIRLLKLVLKNEARKGERVGHYSLDSINDLGRPMIEFQGKKYSEKIIKIGCHDILLSEAILVVGPYING